MATSYASQAEIEKVPHNTPSATPAEYSGDVDLEAQSYLITYHPKKDDSLPRYLTFSHHWYSLDSNEREKRLKMLKQAINDHLKGPDSHMKRMYYLVNTVALLLSIVVSLSVALWFEVQRGL